MRIGLFCGQVDFQYTSYRRLDKIISDYDMSGLSTMQTDLLREERYRVLKAFFPERVLKDYENINMQTLLCWN